MNGQAKDERTRGSHPAAVGDHPDSGGGLLVGVNPGVVDRAVGDPGLAARIEREFKCLREGHLHRPIKARIYLWWSSNPRTMRLCPACGHRILDGDELVDALSITLDEDASR